MPGAEAAGGRAERAAVGREARAGLERAAGKGAAGEVPRQPALRDARTGHVGLRARPAPEEPPQPWARETRNVT